MRTREGKKGEDSSPLAHPTQDGTEEGMNENQGEVLRAIPQDIPRLRRLRLFGTDGIRGTANQFPMTSGTVIRVGQALGYLLPQQKYLSEMGKKNHQGPRKVVIGKDTRLSGYMIEQALASGLNAMGVDVHLVGPLPTPGIGFLTRSMRAAAGVVISASHNPYYDNGIKIFGADGYKIPEPMEREIERLIFDEDLDGLLPPSEQIGRTKRIEDAQGRYIVFVKSTFPEDMTLDGLRIVLDTAHGAAYRVALAIFEELGAEVIPIGNYPDGLNINDGVGALFPSLLAEKVLEYRADLGISLDGDADRVIMVDERGQIMNGDHVLGVCALHMKKRGLLKHNTLVTTQMSNFGLERKMKEAGIHLIKTDVGDKYVVEEMRKKGFNLGGEQSGHIIFLDHTTTGDGCIAALNVLSILRQTGVRLSELNRVIEDVPQILINCRVKNRRELHLVPGYQELRLSIEERLQGRGRLFVRFSGTEPLLRILVEGPDRQEIASYAEEMADFLVTRLSQEESLEVQKAEDRNSMEKKKTKF